MKDIQPFLERKSTYGAHHVSKRMKVLSEKKSKAIKGNLVFYLDLSMWTVGVLIALLVVMRWF